MQPVTIISNVNTGKKNPKCEQKNNDDT